MELVLEVGIVLLTVAVIFNYILTFALIRRQDTNQQVAETELLGVGEVAPDFTAETLNGDIVTRASYAGRSIAFLYFGSSCPTCAEMFPRYDALRLKAQLSGVELVLVSIDSLDQTRAFISQHPSKLPLIVAPRSSNPLKDNYKVSGTPSYCLIDEQGLVLSSGYADVYAQKWQALTRIWEATTPRTAQFALSEGR